MENVTFSEFDTDDEKLKVVNRIIDNMRLIEGKLLQQIALNEKPKPKAKKAKKGMVSVKTLLLTCVLAVAMLVSNANAYVTTDINDEIASNHVLLAQYLRDSFSNVTSDSFLFTPTTEPTGTFATEGRVYYNDVANELRVHNGTSFVSIDTASGNSLDSAYNLGIAITVDNGAVALTSTDAANNVVIAIDQADTAGAVAQTITSAGTGALLSFDSNGTGADILGSDSTWTITKAGASTFVGLDTTGDITLQNDETIKNDNNGEIEFGNGTEDTAIAWGTNELQLSSDTGVVTINYGDVDAFIGVNAISFDVAVANTITQAGTGAGDDLTIQQTASGQDASLILNSTGTAADALKLTASVGGLDIDAVDDIIITVASTTTADDLALVQTGANNSSITLAAAGTGDDAIDLNASAGGIDIDSVKSLTLSSTEATTDSIVISAAGVAGGIDITSLADIDITTTGAAGEDITLTNTGGSINITATEADAGAILVQASAAGGDVNIDSVLGRIDIEAAEDVAGAVLITADGGT